MSARKTERLLNLLIMLLVQRRYIDKQRIREILYPGLSEDAFERKFDRDKEELRSLGVPVEVGAMDAYFDDEVGYRIRPDEFALPDITLEADEAAVVGLAARVWQTAGLAHAATDALRKLTAAGIDIDTSALEIAQPTVIGDDPSFDAFWEAAQTRTPVRFDYRRAGSSAVETRTLQPWGLVRHSGRWYVVGLDVDRGEERVFRLSRLVGAPLAGGRRGSYEVPEGVDLHAVTLRLAQTAPTSDGVLLVRTGAAVPLRRRAADVEDAGVGPDGTSGWDRLTVPGLTADQVLPYGPAVVVEAPATLRSEVVARLTAAIGDAS